MCASSLLYEEEVELPRDTQLRGVHIALNLRDSHSDSLWAVPRRQATDRSVERAICLVTCTQKTVNPSGRWVTCNLLGTLAQFQMTRAGATQASQDQLILRALVLGILSRDHAH